MNNLKRLVNIITYFTGKKNPVYDFSNLNSNHKEEHLLLNILNNKYERDEDAIADIYGSPKGTEPYRMLKHRVYKKLHNHLFFLHSSVRSDKKMEKECHDLVYRGRALFHIAEFDWAENFFKKALAIATKYEFTDITLECYQNLNYIYVQQTKHKLFHSTLKALGKVRALKALEDEAYELYYTARLEMIRAVASRKSYLPKLPEVIHKLTSLWQRTNSFNIFQHYYYLNIWYLRLIGDYDANITILKDCEQLLEEGKINALRFDHRANKYAHISALLRARRFDEGLALAEKYKVAFHPYSRNWFAYMQYYFLLAVHAGNLELAHSLMNEVDSNPYYKRIKTRAKENWTLYKAYLFFLYPKAERMRPFEFWSFLQQMPEHSKDKLGYNVSIIILQFLHGLKHEHYDQLLTKEDSLRKYLNSYLKDANTERSRLFFRLLIVCIRAGFDAKSAEKKGVNWFERLKNAPVPGDAYAQIEIIPYEKLWFLILELLETPKKFRQFDLSKPKDNG